MIDPSSQLAAMIRAQFGAQFRAQARTPAVAGRDSRHEEKAFPEGDRPGDAGGAASAQRLVALRVGALSPEDPQRERKAFRIFLESVLIQAFGRDRLDDRGFDQMVDEVLSRMERDAELNAALQEAGGLLLAEAKPPQPQAPGR